MTFEDFDSETIEANLMICEQLNGTLDKPNVSTGSAYLTISFIFQITYLPCLITFFRPDFRCHSCFKLMIVIGILDIIVTNNDLTITGLFSIIGISYCTAPICSTLLNIISLTSWFAHGPLCIILNFNRCCNLYFRRTLEIFSGIKLWILIGLAFCYAFIMYSNCPQGFFNISLGIWLNTLDPKKETTISLVHLINNACVLAIIVAQYVFIGIILHQRFDMTSAQLNVTRPKLHVLLQSSIICFMLAICSTLYIIIQFVQLPLATMSFIHLSWMLSHGGKGFLYIALNSKIRRNIQGALQQQKWLHKILTHFSKN